MNAVLLNSRRKYTGQNKLQKWEFQCAECKQWNLRKNVQIDHVIECGSLKKPEDIAPFLERLTQESESAYQVLCKKCHKAKTNLNKRRN